MNEFERQLARARARIVESHRKIAKLASIRPLLIDASLRETAAGAAIGQTLQDKVEFLSRIREFGLSNIVLGSLDYAMPDELQVDDDFMVHLRDHGSDRTGCFALTDVGLVDGEGRLAPSSSMQKMQAYGAPNTLHEIYLTDEGMNGQYDRATLRTSIAASVDWLRSNVIGEEGGAPRIIVNIVDACDAFVEDLEWTCEFVALLAGLPIEGVSLEDDRGTFLPFQVADFVAIARDILGPVPRLLVHVHGGAGFENASVMEALLAGADGVWAGLPKRTAVSGHASLAELIANLVRVGNVHMDDYELTDLLPLATEIQTRSDGADVPDDLPIVGRSAYRAPLGFFKQRSGRFMDLPPEVIGGESQYRVCPVMSDPEAIRGRLAEVTGRDAASFDDETIFQMIRLMRRELRAGRRTAYERRYRTRGGNHEFDHGKRAIGIMLRNPNLTLGDVLREPTPTSELGSVRDPLIGPRPDWWWTGVSPVRGRALGLLGDGQVSSPSMPSTITCTREEVFGYFASGWLLSEVLFSGLRGEAAFTRPPYHALRHPMIFYYGHAACLFVNKLLVAGLLERPINAHLERIFEVGVDEMSWDDMSKNEMEWPTVRQVNHYRRQVFAAVSEVIATHPGLAPDHAPIDWDHPLWALFMAMEHERIHLETSSVLIRELPMDLIQRPPEWPAIERGEDSGPLRKVADAVGLDGGLERARASMMPVPAAEVKLGKPRDWPTYGWDNEYGTRTAHVAPFSVSKCLVDNGAFLEFVRDGGYLNEKLWTERGWKWRSFRNTKWPTFWIASGPAGLHEYKLRTIFEVVDLPLDWPVIVNLHEARAYLAWKSARDGRAYRLPTEAEHALLRRGANLFDLVMTHGSKDFASSRHANLNLASTSEMPVDWSRPGPYGVHDAAGNLWDWVEDDFHPLEDFKVSTLYDDFSTPCFDGEHTMILGGSFMSTGDEASIWARYHFRPHFFQHAGFHVVAPSSPLESGAVRGGRGGTSKYEDRAVLDQYLLFHFGSKAHALPEGAIAAGLTNFPERCAGIVVEHATKHGAGLGRALDVGCAVGGASFALAREFQHVSAVDISARFIEAAESLRRGEALPYRIVLEGDLRQEATAKAPPDVIGERLSFRRADACSLPADMAGFDAVLAANLLCRLPSPGALLSRLGGPRGLVKPGGIVVFASPFSWMESFTPKDAWLGGRLRSDAEPRWSCDGLAEALGDEFELVHREDLPFMIREHRRKFEYVVSDLTVWRRKPE